MMVEELDRVIEFVTARPCCLPVDEIEARANQFAAEHDFVAGRDRLRDLVTAIGGRIGTVDVPHLRELDGGSLEVYGPGDFLIKLSPITGPMRDNFTIGHELGHYVLHSGDPLGSERIRVGRWGCDPVEREANQFAAALLMPKESFCRCAAQCGNEPTKLAAHYYVSCAAAAYRLVSLDLATREELGLSR
ncbi:ImmA/IrrE family metallo-endopeptidase [Geminicoccus roseus]|uniref:ImmA/IrrE family metallo-endopeptidase n=1 Tax=Geminicoccus roseus TaxID=404900 RepID=UPI00040BAF03|nr:ImmA/IrrE family metallo-endopeptidase [Geminicoccus roseus]